MLERTNSTTDVARQFHRATTYVSVPDEAGEETFMMGSPPDVENAIWEEDWSVEPFPFKVYETLDPMPLPREFPATAMPALEAIARSGDEPAGERVPDLAALARIGLLSNGILKRGSHRPGGQVIEYRAAGGTGARYHLELYFACGDLPDLAAGLYHYSAQDHSLRQLRSGDFRSILVAAAGREPALAAAPVVLAMTSTFWRNAWRYKGRAYRHALWDAGTCFANVLALAASAELPTRLVLGFADRPVNELLGIDGQREATLALCAIGRTGSDAPPAPTVPPLDLPTKAISSYEVDFPVIGMMHGASTLASGDEAVAWRADPLRREAPEPRGDLIPLRPIPDADIPAMSVEDDHPGPPLDPQLRHGDPDRVRRVLDPARPLDARRRRRLPRAGRVAAARPVPHRQQRRRPEARRLPGASEPGGDRAGPGGNVPEPGAAAGRRAGGPGRRPRERLLPDRARPRPGALRQPRLPGRATGSRPLRQPAPPRHPRARPGRGRVDLAGRRGCRVLHAGRRPSQLHVRRRLRQTSRSVWVIRVRSTFRSQPANADDIPAATCSRDRSVTRGASQRVALSEAAS